MKKRKISFLALSILALTVIIFICCNRDNSKEIAVNRARSEIDDKYKWNLKDIYEIVEDWEKDKTILTQKISKTENLKGTLGKSAKSLSTALDYVFSITKGMNKLYLYAELASDRDTRDAESMKRKQEVSKLWNDMEAAASFIEPEVLAIPEGKLKRFITNEEGLKKYSMYIDNIKRLKSHTLSFKEENLISKAGMLSGLAESTHNILCNAELPFETVKLSDGSKITVNDPTYSKIRYSPDRNDRIIVFNTFFNSLTKFEGTFGNLLYGKLKENLFFSSVKNYNSSVEASLSPKNIPTDVYTNLIKNVKKNIPLLHRYLKIRKKMLGVKELHYYDIYPDLVENVNIKYTYEEGTEIVKSALNILGEEYSTKLNEAFDNRWIDVFPSTGKASGAYSNSAYGIHPYIKLNYNDKFPDVCMLAHELGHSMHSYFSDKNQPYATSYYTSFVAEVAATVNEALVTEHVLEKITDPKEKLSLLGSYLEASRQTVFRQTLFAEFELIINQKVEAGESLTGKTFSELYLELLREYYGHDEGIMVIDDVYGIEWAYIQHFYLGYYNYQYSTSYIAAKAISQKMLTEGQKAVDDYIGFLSSGSSDYSIPLLKKAGVDMLSEEPFDLTMQNIENVIVEMEKLIED